jgi:hypothetical protein
MARKRPNINLPEDDVAATSLAALLRVLEEKIVARVLSELHRPLEPRFLSKKALAEHLGVSERTIKTLRERGLPARKLGRTLFFDVDEVARFIETEGSASFSRARLSICAPGEEEA